MKKWTAALLPLLLLLLSSPPAFAATSSAAVINMHGAKTYLGLASAWGKTWDEDNFEDVTGEDVTYDGSLTVKSGEVANITVSGSSSKLTVQGGVMDSVSCDGSAEIKDGDMKSVDAGGDLKISGGNIRHDVRCDEEASLSSTVKIGGSLEANEITVSSGAKVNVTGTMTAESNINLNNCTLKTRGFDGDDTATLSINQYTATLPPLENMKEIVVKNKTNATADEKIEAGELYITDGAEFSTSSSLELDQLTGPGTLYFHSGKLTVHDSIEGKPLLIFSDHVGKGDTAFYADSDSVSDDDVRLYDYGVEAKDDSGPEDRFVLTNAVSDGITLSNQSLSINPGESATVKAHVKPDFSKFATGTKLVWELYGDTSAFSKSVDSGGLSCKVSVSSSVKGMYKGTLIAYLVDSHGTRLNDYKSDSCVLSTGYSDDPGDGDSGNGTLDTSTVSILTGDRYWVLARTSSSAAPHAMSYNSAVATVGEGKAVKDSSGNPAWIYPITGTGKGQVTIEIDGQKVIARVSSGITIDTSSYTMAPGGSYVIGVTTKGVEANSIWASSDQSSVSVQYVGKSGSMFLYRISGRSAGNATVTFSITGGESVGTAVSVKNGARAGGVSARLVALA
ncbi:hypothetical protein [Caproicibacter fermentans]|uniref:Carbohydrate-binding domain-containing protein n=1 Tax=Caproicibacter fermentans TaxID=2576756 RepID=A0A7G8TDH7_9FIRM|nr:hypothetical protein [Caproicibacter fermentans]QNK41668.1 hypothetical protein HCR03_05285 [Caproicibacter fermentans]